MWSLLKIQIVKRGKVRAIWHPFVTYRVFKIDLAWQQTNKNNRFSSCRKGLGNQWESNIFFWRVFLPPFFPTSGRGGKKEKTHRTTATGQGGRQMVTKPQVLECLAIFLCEWFHLHPTNHVWGSAGQMSLRRGDCLIVWRNERENGHWHNLPSTRNSKSWRSNMRTKQNPL